MEVRDVVVPRYGTRSVAELLPSALGALRAAGATDVLGIGEARAVGVLVIDGLGYRQLLDHRDAAPFLGARAGDPIDSVLPSTTVAALASVGTGLPPGEHGVVGTTVAFPGGGPPFDVLHWTIEEDGRPRDARGLVRPESFQPFPTQFDRARRSGIRAVSVLREEFVGSGLTRAALRDGEVVLAEGLDATLAAMIEALREPGPVVVYGHHGDLDGYGHVFGPHTDRWTDELARIDAAIATVAARLPDDAVLVVTADHGMVPTPDGAAVEVADRPELLAGVAGFAGEPRARHAVALDGAAEDVHAAWTEVLAGSFVVARRREAIAAGWFGPTVTIDAEARMGDVIAMAATPGVSLVHRDVDPRGGRFPGMHAGVLRDEVEVPAIAVRREDAT